MAILNILHYPDSRLRQKALPVKKVDSQIKQLVDDMFETMYDAPGIGLAATQANVQQRIIVIDISEDKSEPYCFINPKIMQSDGEEEMEEGCLSVPGIYEKVTRAEHILVSALGREGKEFELEANGVLSTCIQHEIDHLEGKLFVDYLSELKRQRIRKKMEKLRQKTM
jgi:peptide deformylase